MAEAPSLIYNDTPGAIPANYRFPPGLDARLSSVSATFNGAGASGDFLACLAVYSQDGKLIGRFPTGSPVAAGDSAEVTFAPFLTADAEAPSAGGGIEFGGTGQVYGTANSGDFLDVLADGDAPASRTGYGIALVTEGVATGHGSAGIYFDSTEGQQFFINASGGPALGTPQMYLNSDNDFEMDAGTKMMFFPGFEFELAVSLDDRLTILSEDPLNGDLPTINLILDSFASGAGDGNKLIVWDQDPLGPGANPIFEIWDDGTIHGRVSVGAITWDLPG